MRGRPDVPRWVEAVRARPAGGVLAVPSAGAQHARRYDFDAALDPVIASLDTPVRRGRAALARVVVGLTAAGRVDPDVAAVAMIDLTMPESALFTSTVAEAVGVGWRSSHSGRVGARRPLAPR